MLREYFKSWNKFEITLVLLGTMGVIVFGCIFKSAILSSGMVAYALNPST